MLFYYSLLILPCVLCGPLPKKYEILQYKNNPSVKKLQEYIRIDTSHADNIELAVDFWRRQADELGLPFKVYRPGRLPVCVTTLIGRKPNLPSILLNSHSDVVPAESDLWTYDPFSAYIDDNGDLFGRGTQDTKGVGVQYMEAIRKIVQNNITLDRTVHVMVVPDCIYDFRIITGDLKDEETGSFEGLKPFVKTDEFKSLNIGFALDEGLTSSDETLAVTYVDKRPWQMRFNIQGPSGHGSSLQNGSTSTIEQINSWLSQLSSETTLDFLYRVETSAATAVDDSNPYWVAIRDTIKDLGLKIVPIVCPATTDMLVLRGLGIPAIGFSSRTNMISKLHDVDEYIPVDNFLRGIDIYVALIKRLANLPDKKNVPDNCNQEY